MASDLRYKRLATAKMAGLSVAMPLRIGLWINCLVSFLMMPKCIVCTEIFWSWTLFLEGTVRPMDSRLRKAREHYSHLMISREGGCFALFDLAGYFFNIGKLRVAEHLFRQFVLDVRG